MENRSQPEEDKLASGEAKKSEHPLGGEAGTVHFQQLGLFGLIVSDLVVFPGLGYGLGYFAYKRFHLSQWGMVLGLMLGLLGAFYQIFRRTHGLKGEK